MRAPIGYLILFNQDDFFKVLMTSEHSSNDCNFPTIFRIVGTGYDEIDS